MKSAAILIELIILPLAWPGCVLKPVKVTVISANLPKSLTFQNPTLTAQTYHVEVRKRFSATGPLRAGSLPSQTTGLTQVVNPI